MHRRTVLLGTGVAISVSIAGCADDAGSDDENGNGADDAGNGVDDTETDDENSSDDDVDTDEEGEDDDSDGETEDEETGTEMSGLEITEQEFEEDDFWVWVSGIVANNTGEELGSVEVTVTFYDENGEELEETVTSTSGLEDEEEWAFEVMEDGEDVADYSVAITDAVPAERTPT